MCTLKDDAKVNIEVQRANDDDHFRSVRFNSSLVTVVDSNAGDKFKDVIELFCCPIRSFLFA